MTLPINIDDFGFMTAARTNKKEITQSIGLALSLELKCPDIPRAIVCNRDALDHNSLAVLKDHFAHIVQERTDIKGWHHKLYLDKYTPFRHTLFLDSDMLVVRDIMPWINRFSDKDFTYWGVYRERGKLWEGPVIEKVLSNIGREHLPCIRGGGHYFFRKDSPLFNAAREIARPEIYRKLIGNYMFTDETAVMVATALERYEIVTSPDSFVTIMDPLLRKGSVRLDCASSEFEVTSNGFASSLSWEKCPWITDNQKISGAIAHFSGDRDTWIYYSAFNSLKKYFSQSGRKMPQLPSNASIIFMHATIVLRRYVRHKVLKLQFKEK